jgi:hypothetical protein
LTKIRRSRIDEDEKKDMAMSIDTAEIVEKTDTHEATTYRPNPAGRKLLEVLLNPEHRFKPVTEICVLAKINRRTYYRLAHDKKFMCHYKSESQRFVRMSQGPMVSALVKSAVRGNPQNLKTALAMADLYKEKMGMVLNPDANGNPQPVQLKSDMELAVKFARAAHLLLSNPQVAKLIQDKLNANTNAGNGIDSGDNAIDLVPDATDKD